MTDTGGTWRTLGPLSALIVEPTIAGRVFAVSALTDAGIYVTVADSFVTAKARLVGDLPRILLTELRLGEYNGLHLVLRAKANRPDIAAVVTSDYLDPVLQAETERMGATFVLKPVSRQDLLAALARTLNRADGDPAIRAPFERRSGERRSQDAGVLDQERRKSDRRRHSGFHQIM